MKNNLRCSQMLHLQLLPVAIAASLVISYAPLAHAQTPIAPPTNNSAKAAKTFNHVLDAELLAAVKANEVAAVRSLLARNADPNVKDSGGAEEPVLVTAVFNGNVDMVRALVEAGANLEATTVHGSSPLSMAALKGRVEISKYLLQRGAKVEGADPDGTTPLMLAARSGETDIVRALIADKANVNARTSAMNGSQTPLHYACEDSSFGIVKLEIVKMLVEAGADVSLKNGEGKMPMQIAAFNKGRTKSNAVFYVFADIEKYLTGIYKRDGALFMAIGKIYSDNGNLNSTTRAADWQAVKDALAGGATARFTDDASGGTTLIFSAYDLRDADDATMQTLVARSNLNAQEKQYGFSALHLAVTNNNLKMIGWIIQARANLNLLDRNQKTPLDLSAKNPAINALLKKAGAKTSAEMKAEAARLAILKMTQQERDITLYKAQPTDNDQALFEAVEGIEDKYFDDEEVTEADWDVVRKLLDGGATGRYAGSLDRTALMIIADSFQDIDDDLQQKILARSNVNAQDFRKDTALHTAAGIGNLKMVGWLIKAGANLNHLNARNETPLDLMLKETLVVKPNRQNIIALLKDAGAKTSAELK